MKLRNVNGSMGHIRDNKRKVMRLGKGVEGYGRSNEYMKNGSVGGNMSKYNALNLVSDDIVAIGKILEGKVSGVRTWESRLKLFYEKTKDIRDEDKLQQIRDYVRICVDENSYLKRSGKLKEVQEEAWRIARLPESYRIMESTDSIEMNNQIVGALTGNDSEEREGVIARIEEGRVVGDYTYKYPGFVGSSKQTLKEVGKGGLIVGTFSAAAAAVILGFNFLFPSKASAGLSERRRTALVDKVDYEEPKSIEEFEIPRGDRFDFPPEMISSFGDLSMYSLEEVSQGKHLNKSSLEVLAQR